MNTQPITAGSGEDSGQTSSLEVLADATPSDTRDGFISGPWDLIEADDERNAVISPPVANLHAGDTWWTAVIICSGHQTANAVARRMHAANDMLAALKELMEQPTMNPLAMTPDQRSALWSAHGKARAAISKATGVKP